MYILTKIFVNYLQYTYYNKFTFVSTFIKLLICILITVSIFLLSFPSNIEITDLDIALNKQNLLYLNLIFILSTYFLGLIKNIPGPEIIPYLNLPIKKNILLFFFLILSYFETRPQAERCSRIFLFSCARSYEVCAICKVRFAKHTL